MSTDSAQEGEAPNRASSIPANSTPAQADGTHNPPVLSRAELRTRALESRSSYELGELPSEEAGTEIDDALRLESQNDSSIGIAYKFLVLEDIPDNERINALRESFGHTGPGTANGLRQHLDAIRFGIFPQGTSMARQIAARIKSIMRRHEFSDSTFALLQQNIAALEKIASDINLFEDEQIKAEAAEKYADDKLKGRSGVYVFTYPHYMRHPTHESAESEKMPDRTLMKVGFSNSGILKRVNQETRATGVPEHRRILRAYLTVIDKTSSSKEIERQFHRLLDTAGHAGPKRGSTERQMGGNEWFYTSVEFLDAIAETLKLEIIEVDAPEL